MGRSWSPARRTSTWITAIRALSWRDRWLLVQACLILPGLSLLLRFVTFRRAYAVCGRLVGRRLSRASHADAAVRVREVARIVAMASRHAAVPGTCLHRSLALWWMLRRQGYESDLRFGARKVDGVLTAHAWVEHQGVVINDDPATTREYAVLPWVAARTRS